MVEFIKTWILTAFAVAFCLVAFTSESRASVCYETAGPGAATIKSSWYSWISSRSADACVDSVGVCDGAALSGFVGADGICHRQLLFTAADFAQFQSMQIDVATLKGSADLIYDPALAAAFWSVAFFFTLGCWLLAKNYGLILHAIKRF